MAPRPCAGFLALRSLVAGHEADQVAVGVEIVPRRHRAFEVTQRQAAGAGMRRRLETDPVGNEAGRCGQRGLPVVLRAEHLAGGDELALFHELYEADYVLVEAATKAMHEALARVHVHAWVIVWRVRYAAPDPLAPALHERRIRADDGDNIGCGFDAANVEGHAHAPWMIACSSSAECATPATPPALSMRARNSA